MSEQNQQPAIGSADLDVTREVGELEAQARYLEGEAGKAALCVLVFSASAVGVVVLTLFLLVYIPVVYNLAWESRAPGALLATCGTAGGASVLFFASLAFRSRWIAQRYRDKSSRLRIKVQGHERVIEAQKSKAPFLDRIVDLNIENLDGCYRLVRAHAAGSFTLASSACAVGFLFILFGLSTALFIHVHGTPLSEVITARKHVGFAAAAAGAITEFIAAAFFALYARTIRQLKAYHNSLVELQNTMLCFRMIDEVGSPVASSPLLAALVERIRGGSRRPADLLNADVAPRPGPRHQGLPVGA